ncbi:MAG: hypothetical protein JO127_11920 [Caulobacteraceae bacterium]|nr:hypothetical protein [Caulobacteraceae bacterium]
MPVAQLIFLGVVLSVFAIFMIVLMAVSIYVSMGGKSKEAKTSVIPARRAGETSLPHA